MTDRGPQARPSARRITIPAARTGATIAGWLALHYLLPLDREATSASVTILVIGLVFLVGLVIVQVRSVLVAKFSGIGAVEAPANARWPWLMFRSPRSDLVSFPASRRRRISRPG